MSCALLDLGCHVQSSLWGLIGLVPWWAWVALAVAALGVAYRLGGWPAVGALLFGYGWAWGSRRSIKPDPPKTGRTITPRKPAGKRRYNPDTNSWE